jgi:hypothetical protein
MSDGAMEYKTECAQSRNVEGVLCSSTSNEELPDQNRKIALYEGTIIYSFFFIEVI